ncbi:hypothetical protein KIN20_021218 [Parelaphostrongylus tenuis]|uniref:Uncharacterized protein n=1 Tax=Parelaphostrongylus tenuis TaxID=148309 RepID=A0AAD5QUC4_PARTN|nr:hypothetical protein KIN20_021218 [Parelaphostrongylus tenuis]
MNRRHQTRHRQRHTDIAKLLLAVTMTIIIPTEACQQIDAGIGKFVMQKWGARKNEDQGVSDVFSEALNMSRSLEEVVKLIKNTGLRVHLCESTIILAVTYAAGNWSLRK